MIIKVIVFVVLYCVWVMVALAGVSSVLVNSEGYLNPLGLVLYIALIMVPIWLFNKWFNGVPSWVAKVRAEGKQAPATILSVKETGMIINRTIDVVKVQLLVEPSGEPPFEVKQERRISLFSGFGGLREGAHVQVKYDPNNKQHVVIMDDADSPLNFALASKSSSTASYGTESPGSAMARNLAELSHLHKSGELSDAEFETAKKKLLS